MAIASLLLFPIAVAVFGFIIVSVFGNRHDPKEPPLVHSSVPVLGHITGLIRNGIPHLTQYGKLQPELSAYTVDLIANKFYMINSPCLVSAVQRNHRVISMEPFLTGATNRMAGIEDDGINLLREEQNRGASINNKVIHAIHPALLGAGLDKMNNKMISYLKLAIDEVVSRHQTSYMDLHMWCRNAMTIASTDAVYGDLNPYRSKVVRDSFWAFETNLSLLLMKVFPRWTSQGAWQGRERLVAALVDYYNAKGHENSSEMTWIRWETQHNAGATTKNIARLEAALGIGLLSNTVPTTFWTLFEIYSRPDLLTRIRDELRQHALTKNEGNVHVLDLGAIRDHCGLLVSTYLETLRLRTNGTATRIICKDTVLQDQYLLKKGSLLMIPAAIINKHESAWGKRASEFNPERFLKDQMDTKRSSMTSAYMSFGSTPNICPGRHFASGEILSFTAMMVLRCDIVPESGAWAAPKLNYKAMTATITPPCEPFNVKIVAREEYKGTQWEYRVSPGSGLFRLVTG